jgi:Mrp family chromosome partitioning ATPase
MSLGQSLATSGYRVAVVDAVSDPSSAIGADRDGSGLADLILGGPVPDVLPLERVGRVQVLRSGSLSDAVRERLSGREMREVLDRLQAESDYVLVAVPHTGSWDGLAVLLAVDKVVLLVTERATTHEQVASAASAVGRVGVTVLGVLVQKAAHGRTSRGRSAIGPDAGRTRPHVARPGGELPDDADFEVDPENSRRVTVPSMPPR